MSELEVARQQADHWRGEYQRVLRSRSRMRRGYRATIAELREEIEALKGGRVPFSVSGANNSVTDASKKN